MAEHSFIRTTPFVLKGDQSQLEEVPDQIFVDLHGIGDTKFLYAGCYDQAVQDCVVMGDNCFVLKVRPELRGLLISQLRKQCKVMKIYRYPEKPETRLLMTEELSVRFMEETSSEKRRACLGRYFTESCQDRDPEDGAYRLKGALAADPLSASRSLKRESAIQEAALLAFTFPTRVLMAT